jgi:hypothetical protein
MAKMTDYRMKVKRDSDRLIADLSRRLGFIENITDSAACTLNQKQLLFQRMWKENHEHWILNTSNYSITCMKMKLKHWFLQ